MGILRLSRTIRAALAVGVVILLGGCGGGAADGPSARQAEQAPTPVTTAAVRRGLVEAYYHGSTNLTASEEAVVVARTPGIVEQLFVEEGDAVKAGQPLAQIDTERLELEVTRSKAQLENLEAIHVRAEQLYAERMISPDEYDTARFNHEAEQASLALHEYALREATIRATLDGVITRRHIKVGHTLELHGPAFEVKRLDTIEAELKVPEREIGRIRIGQQARLSIDALPQQQFEGEVARMPPEVDPNSGTFRVTVVLDNKRGSLRPGMFGRVEILVDRRENTLVVPAEAVLVTRDRSSLFVVNGGIAESRSVAAGYASGGVIEILSGASEGELAVTAGQEGLRDGAPVRVVEGYATQRDAGAGRAPAAPR